MMASTLPQTWQASVISSIKMGRASRVRLCRGMGVSAMDAPPWLETRVAFVARSTLSCGLTGLWRIPIVRQNERSFAESRDEA